MKGRHTSSGLVALACAGLAFAAAPPAPVRKDAPVAPRLVVVVSVDQMRADYLERFGPLLKGGLARILAEGAVFTNARYRHACTETGPGHSVLLSSRSPRSTGIVGNRWYDRTLRRRVNVVEDPTVRAVGGSGRAASPAHFVGHTLGDVLKQASPGSRVVTLSFKDRVAILMGGKRADAAYWYEGGEGRLVTSTHYVRRTPPWLERWNARRLPDGYMGRIWERLLPDPALYVAHAGEDAAAGEWDLKDTVFPHRVRGAAEDAYYDGLRRTPFADSLLLDAASEALLAHDLGRDEVTDLLAVGFSACDAIGHTYGPDSQEMMDYILRLDRTLGAFLDTVERQAGRGRVLVVLTADHGVMPLVETLRRQGKDARRVRGDDIHARVLEALAERFPQPAELFADPDPLEYVFDAAVLARRGIARAEAEQAVRAALLATGFVDAVYTARELMGDAPPGDSFFPLHERAFFAPRSGDLIARIKPYVYVSDWVGGTGHGTPHDYDRHVPIVFMGPGIVPGRHDVACGPEDIAWTLGRALGLDYARQDAETDLLPYLTPHPSVDKAGSNR